MSNNNYSSFHYANASSYNGVPITYVTVANAVNSFQPAAMASGGRIVTTNYTSTGTPGNNVVGPIAGGGGTGGNATRGCYPSVLGRPILAAPPTYDVTKTYYQQSTPNYTGVINLGMSKVHYPVPTVHKKPVQLIGPKITKNNLTMGPNKSSKLSSMKSGGINNNSSTIAPPNYNANLYSSTSIYAAAVAASNSFTSTTTVTTTANSTAIINKLPKQQQQQQQQQKVSSMNIASTSKIHNNSNFTIANCNQSDNLISVPSNIIADNNSGNGINISNNTNHYIASNSTTSVTASHTSNSNNVVVTATNSNSPWTAYRRGNPGGSSSRRSKVSTRPQQLHYCEVCKISCAGPQTYREHLEGQKHKKREASLKMQASAQSTAQNRGNNYHCDLCDVTCTGTGAYAAHKKGSKHHKVVILHQKLGKPIPTEDQKKMAKIDFVPATISNNVTDNTQKIENGVNTTCGGTGLVTTITVTGNGQMKKDENQSNETITVKNSETAKTIVVNSPNKIENKTVVNSAYTIDEKMASTVESFGTNSSASAGDMAEIKPVGGEYIEEVKDKDGRTLSFNCKLCDCKFNDPNAKEMHMKGRRHRLQYKRKVQPDLIVDFKPTLRQRRAVETRAQRALMQGFNEPHENIGGGGPNRNIVMTNSGPNEYCSYWEEQRRRTPYDEEYDYNNWMSAARGFSKLKCNQRYNAYMGNGPPPFLGIIPGAPNTRRPESSDDRHAIARHAEIYPKEQELQMIQRIVSHSERALKFVSDILAEGINTPSTSKKEKVEGVNGNAGGIVKDGRDNQMLSFQKEADLANMRILKGVMRVGFLAKGLLLQGDKDVELVVLCSEKPTVGLLKRVGYELPQKLKEICGDNPINYKINIDIDQAAVLVYDDYVSVKISLTSPLLREQNESGSILKEPIPNIDNTIDTNSGDTKLLPREPCLKALAELRHAKWFQARATGLQSCVMVLRILRDLCRRSPAWLALPQWSMELFVEKVISSAGFPISPGDCLRRIMEAFASGFLISGPGLIDPCEKEPMNALQSLTIRDCERITCSAQQFLRFISFRQIHRVLGMEQLPSLKFPSRPWRINRKRRRQSGKVATHAGNSNNTNVDTDDTVTSEKIPKRSATETST